VLSITRYLKKTYQKIILALILSVVFLLITAVMRTTVRQAGGLACFFIAAILILAVLKVLFLEFVEDNVLRKKGKRVFEFCHACFGWITFGLIVYHSLFFISLAFWPVYEVSTNYIITGILALIPLSLVITSGLDKNIAVGNIKEVKSVYFNHIFMTILLAILIVVHINFQ
jgi:hypothetical protein